MDYCEAIWQTTRRKTREVVVGNIGVGGDNPIRIQSMTTSSTRDVDATVDQIIRLADRGCDIARMTVQGKKEAEACEAIKNSLLQKGYTIPLVADIHFYPAAAMTVVEFVDKVRINPGNYLDKRASFQVLEYTDEEYAAELVRLEDNFTPLVMRCKELKKAMRIGTNHGSLSDRIMNRYGDTPSGMVESALEYARVCRKLNYHDFIFSMKASNTHVMIQAYRLLSAKMIEMGWDYPLHLGVTEAGEGEDGRIKSSIGIGSLLLDGIGDTVRVSLTEDPWHEIDPCKKLRAFAENYIETGTTPFEETHRNIESSERREIVAAPGINLHRDGTVVLKVTAQNTWMADFYASLGYEGEKLKKSPATVDLLFTEDKALANELADNPIIGGVITPTDKTIVVTEEESGWGELIGPKTELILLKLPPAGRVQKARKFFEWLQEQKIKAPVLLNFSYDSPWDETLIAASAECGSLLCDGLGDGLLLEGPYPIDELRKLSFAILQSSRMRTVKTEFISCPGCGRTLFNLQQVSERIRQRTEHLPGVKIAIMGCIVNGPGEMADADFGYVGTRPGKIDLYVGKTCVEKNIDHDEADERLIDLIKEHGRWVEKDTPELITT